MEADKAIESVSVGAIGIFIPASVAADMVNRQPLRFAPGLVPFSGADDEQTTVRE